MTFKLRLNKKYQPTMYESNSGYHDRLLYALPKDNIKKKLMMREFLKLKVIG